MSNTFKTSKNLVLMAALVALLASPASVMAGPPKPVKQAPVNLRNAGKFVILSTAGITDVSPSAIVGNIGTSPITGASIQATDGNICDEVLGKIYTIDATPTGPACEVVNPTLLGAAVLDMGTAYADAAGRTSTAIVTELGAGDISGMTLAPGLYKWGTGVLINAGASGDPLGVTLHGGKNDVWIFQIATDLTVGNGAVVTLTGGAQAKNIFWQVGTQTTLGTTANFKGIILSGSAIVMNGGATLTGRALAGTEVTLIGNAVIQPNVTK
jgi:hypothetical protein